MIQSDHTFTGQQECRDIYEIVVVTYAYNFYYSKYFFSRDFNYEPQTHYEMNHKLLFHYKWTHPVIWITEQSLKHPII